MKLYSSMFLILCAFASLTARAEDAAAGSSDRLMFKAGGVGTMGWVHQHSPYVSLAFLPADHVLLAGGLRLNYNGNLPTDKWATGAFVAAEYMVVDKFPFAMGPQAMFEAKLSPGDAFSDINIGVGLGFWYAPWNAPVAIGSALAANINVVKGAKATFSLSTPAVRLVYVFN